MTSSAQADPPTQVAGVEPAAATDQSPARVSEVPPDIVTADDFPGAFRLPGSDAALRIGGLVRVNWVSTYSRCSSMTASRHLRSQSQAAPTRHMEAA